MSDKVKINGRLVGEGEPTFIIAEIGINHNGKLDLAKKLIDVAVSAGCDAVKFQKRTVEDVFTEEELNKDKESPYGTTYREYKHGIEFGKEEYQKIDDYCDKNDIVWFASPWDTKSVDFLEQFDVSVQKVASPLLTNDELLKKIKSTGKPIIMSTGMSNKDEIRHAVDIVGKEDLILNQCTSTYPSDPEELNLRAMEWLKEEFRVPIGYSGHEVGLSSTVVAVALGAVAIERHITLDRSMWGSDQSASVEPQGFKKLVRDIGEVPVILGDKEKKVVESEKPIREKLRKHKQ